MRANLFYTNPRVSALLVLFIVVLGGAAFAGLARQEDPKMAERYGMVVTFLPGATAQRMETLISEPIETALREIPDIKELNSSSKGGQSVVSIELYESVADAQTDNVWSQVRDVLGDTVPTLPPGTGGTRAGGESAHCVDDYCCHQLAASLATANGHFVARCGIPTHQPR